MLKGWFDAFRTEGGPTLYAYSNRTAVTEDIRNIIIYLSFSTLFLAFLIVFPGIRKEVRLPLPRKCAARSPEFVVESDARNGVRRRSPLCCGNAAGADR